MVRETTKITKDQFDRCHTDITGRRYVPNNMYLEVFGEALVRGYGVYGNHVYEKEGEYYCDYSRGKSCD